ncbi:xylulokinase [Clostridia bacterium]|nr:xylulokinase [Clostridia bacterium]
MNYLIGIDLGTQSTKAGLVSENGQFVCEAAAASNLIYPEAGAVEQDPEEMLASVILTIKEVLAQSKIAPGDVAGIGIDGQMAGIMGVGKDGLAAIPYDSWLDTRCGKSRKAFLDFGEERTIALTGAPVTYAHGPKILWWKQERPEAYRKIYKFVQPGSYCAMRLCGLSGDEAFIDHTYLHFSGFADTARKCWSEELIEGLELDGNKLPAITTPWAKIGGLTAEMAEATGLFAGTPVVAGCGDTAATSFGAGIVRSGLLFDVAGTASILSGAVGVFAPDIKNKTILFAPSVVPGLYTPMAYINGGGMCLNWFRDDVLGGKYSFDELNVLAADALPGSKNLIFLPHFSGRVCPNDTLVRGSFLNLSWEVGAPEMYRSILEGISYEYGLYLDIIRKLVPDQTYEKVVSIGGGSKNQTLAQIKADVLGIPISKGDQADTAMIGCCSIAGYGVGLFDDLTKLVMGTEGEMTAPDPSLYEFYGKRKAIYADVFDALHGVYRDLLLL